MIGTTIDQFEILEEIGRGGMGVVYLARQQGLDRLVALKFLPFADQGLGQRLRREAATLAELQHPNIVPIFSVGEHNGSPYYAMSYCPGGSLADVHRANGTLTTGQVCGLLAPVADALGALHRRGMVHRDIKPSNVLLSADGQPFVSDFGLALGSASSRSTNSGNMLGTLGYSAPELLSGGAPTAASDVFSFGVLGYEMAAGRAPFVGVHVSGVLDAVRRGEFVPLASLSPHLDPRMVTLIESCLAADPAQRPSDLATVANELRAIAPLEPVQPARRPDSMVRTIAPTPRDRPAPPVAQVPTGTTLEVAPARQPEHDRRRSWMLIAAALLLLGIAGGIGYVVTRGDSSPATAASTEVVATVTMTKTLHAVTGTTTWTIIRSGGSETISGATTLSGTPDIDGIFTWDEIVPKALVASVDELDFATPPSSVVDADPIVRYCLDMGNGPQSISWSAKLPTPVDAVVLGAQSEAWKAQFDEHVASPGGTACTSDAVVVATTSTTSPPTSTKGGNTSSGGGNVTPTPTGTPKPGGVAPTPTPTTTPKPGVTPTPTPTPKPPTPTPTPTPIPAPAPPASVTVTGIGSRTATVNWTASPTAGVTYRVSLDGTVVGSGAILTKALSGLAIHSSHTVSVVAVGADGQSSTPKTAAFTTTAGVAPVATGWTGGSCKAVSHTWSLNDPKWVSDADGDIVNFDQVTIYFSAATYKWSWNSTTGVFKYTWPAGTADGTHLKFTWRVIDSQGHASNTVTFDFRATGNCA